MLLYKEGLYPKWSMSDAGLLNVFPVLAVASRCVVEILSSEVRSNLLIGGELFVLQSHIMAAKAIASTLKTSLGPNGEYLKFKSYIYLSLS